MIDQPNPAVFSVDERPREYRFTIQITGTMSVTVSADSEDEARLTAEDQADKIAEDTYEAELDEIDDVRVERVWKTKPMYRVTRDGRKMQVSRLEQGDLPREPDERGF